MLINLFLVSHFTFLFIQCGRLSWLPISFLLHVEYTLSWHTVKSLQHVVSARKRNSSQIRNFYAFCSWGINCDATYRWAEGRCGLDFLLYNLHRIWWPQGSPVPRELLPPNIGRCQLYHDIVPARSAIGRSPLPVPMAWNALPGDLRDPSLIADNFRKTQKTHLFRNALGHLAH